MSAAYDGLMRDAAHEIMVLLFRHGYLGVRHVAHFLEDPRDPKVVSRTLAELYSHGLLNRTNHINPYNPVNTPGDGSHDGETSERVRARKKWEIAYSLSEGGVRWAADEQELSLKRASVLHNKVCGQARVNHALLRAEFYLMLLVESRRRLHAQGGNSSSAPLVCRIESLGAETEAGPIELARTPKGWKRSLESDGLIIASRDDVPTLLAAMVESDTGSQRFHQIAPKADAYAEYLSDPDRRDSPVDLSKGLPRVVFVSPTAKRSRAVRGFILENANNSSSDFARFRERVLAERGVDLADYLCVTNLEWLRQRGSWGPAYWFLGASKRRRLF